MNKVITPKVNESFKKKVKALVPFDVCGETNDRKNLKSFRCRFTTIF